MGIISKLKNYLPEHALFELFHTLVHCHLIYGLIVWGNTYPTYLSKLIALQNKALRIVTGSGWYQNALPLSQKFNLLSLVNLHKFETANSYIIKSISIYLQILIIISHWPNSSTVGFFHVSYACFSTSQVSRTKIGSVCLEHSLSKRWQKVFSPTI